MSVTLLQPAKQLRERGLVIEEATLAPDEEDCVSIPIQNFSNEPLCLEPGDILGQVQPVTLITDPTPLVDESIKYEKVLVSDSFGGSDVDSNSCGGSDVDEVVVGKIDGNASRETDDNHVPRQSRLLNGVHIDNSLSPEEVKTVE